MPLCRVLIADDDPVIRDILCEIIQGMGYETGLCDTACETVKKIAESFWDIVLLDLHFPDCSDLSTLEKVKEISPNSDVILVTGETDDLRLVSEAIKLGAFDYIPKPIREDDIRIRLTRLVEMRGLSRDRDRAVGELARGREFSDIIGESSVMKNIVSQSSQLANYDVSVLITGETGTGKELIARALHYGGERRNKPFVAINCASLPQTMIESELFGRENTNSSQNGNKRAGAFEEADEGTLFLDEIGDMNMPAQAALLRVLERGEFRSATGSIKKVSARIVLATNHDLDALIEEGRFRKDLFYRINRMKIHIPPLRSRREDTVPLARHFLAITDQKIGKGVKNISAEAEEMLARYDWPGNVRELRNEIERAYIVTSDNQIRPLDLSPEIISYCPEPDSSGAVTDQQSLDDLHRLLDALRASGGNISKAASDLGVHRNTVHRWMKKFALLKEIS